MADKSPFKRTCKVVIVGAGISGLAQGIRLRQALGSNVEITILEKAGSAGGVWRDSTWPGASVDIPIHLYSLYSDLKPDWANVYASQEEVLGYWENLIDRHQLRHSIRFNTEWQASNWREESQTHLVTAKDTISQEIIEIETNVLISANGPLSTPKIPRIPGLDLYEGVLFHNLRWNKAVDFVNKHVVVVGSGSSAVQLIPGVSKIAGVKLTQIIRSGGYFFPKPNPRFTRWQLFCFKWIPGWIYYYRLRLFLQHNTRWKTRSYASGQGHTALERELLDYLEKNAPPQYLAALKPDYPLGCKRPAFDAGWLDSLNQDNVHLTNSAIIGITKDSVETADGQSIKADILIFATGSDVAEHGVGLNVNLRGEKGLELQTFWKAIGGPQAYLGIAVPKFPNYFMVVGPNAIAGSWGYTIGNQTAVIARLVKEMFQYKLSSIQPREEVFQSHNLDIQAVLTKSTMASNDCTNWWRIEGGRISVPNSLSAIGLWLATRTTQWSDWKAERLHKGSAASEVVDVTDLRAGRLLKKALIVAAIGSISILSTSAVRP